MALDEVNQRLFVGGRRHARLIILDTVSGQIVSNMKACGDTDDLFYDSADRALYLSGGNGCMSVFDAVNPNSYQVFRTITTPIGACTSLFVPGNRTLYVAVPHRGSQKAKILIFRTVPNS